VLIPDLDEFLVAHYEPAPCHLEYMHLPAYQASQLPRSFPALVGDRLRLDT
jgi:hypothetical protein